VSPKKGIFISGQKTNSLPAIPKRQNSFLKSTHQGVTMGRYTSHRNILYWNFSTLFISRSNMPARLLFWAVKTTFGNVQEQRISEVSMTLIPTIEP